ncbi:MAG: hypothetical protein KC418_14555 [Anaerolineales bacterium]|nr:hypothetical protein [Anaerolineales bacterium]
MGEWLIGCPTLSSLKKPGFLIVRLKLPEWFMCKNPVFGLFSVESTLKVLEIFKVDDSPT